MKLTQLSNAPLVLDTNQKLLLRFKQHTKHTKDLLGVNDIDMRETEFTATILHFIQKNGGEDLENKAAPL